MIGAYRIEAYVIASADGMLADASGVQPASLHFEADQRHFREGLDQADVVVNGRHSPEGDPNAMNRRRLVVTRQVASLAPDPDNPKARLWNPAGASLEAACAALGMRVGHGRCHWRPAGLHPVSQARIRLLSPEPRDQCASARRPAGLQPRGFGGDPDAALSGCRPQSSAPLWLDDGLTLTDWARPE